MKSIFSLTLTSLNISNQGERLRLVGIADCDSLGKSSNWHRNAHPTKLIIYTLAEFTLYLW
ncbi:MAG: hypothetical protein AB4426_17515 [Xenococcaceae cyanobacterium]